MTTPVRTETRRTPMATNDAEPAGASVVPPAAPKLRQQPLLVIFGVGMVALGALLGVWAWTSATSTIEVVATRTLVARGELIEAQDLVVLRVNPDPALKVVPASQFDALVGRRATTDMVAGALVSPEQVADTVLPPAGLSLVGVPLAAGQLPVEQLRGGDRVRIVQTPGAQADVEGSPVTVSAEVVRVGVVDGKTVVDLLVPSTRAAELGARANTGKVVLVLDTRER